MPRFWWQTGMLGLVRSCQQKFPRFWQPGQPLRTQELLFEWLDHLISWKRKTWVHSHNSSLFMQQEVYETHFALIEKAVPMYHLCFWTDCLEVASHLKLMGVGNVVRPFLKSNILRRWGGLGSTGAGKGNRFYYSTFIYIAPFIQGSLSISTNSFRHCGLDKLHFSPWSKSLQVKTIR